MTYKKKCRPLSANEKIFFEIYLLGKPRGDSNSQPRGKYHGSMQLSYWATHKLTNQNSWKMKENWDERMDSHHRPPRTLPLALYYWATLLRNKKIIPSKRNRRILSSQTRYARNNLFTYKQFRAFNKHLWQVQNSNLWPLGHEPSELPTAPTCDVCSLSSQTSCIFNWINLNMKYNELLFGGDGGLEPPSHDDKNGII